MRNLELTDTSAEAQSSTQELPKWRQFWKGAREALQSELRTNLEHALSRVPEFQQRQEAALAAYEEDIQEGRKAIAIIRSDIEAVFFDVIGNLRGPRSLNEKQMDLLQEFFGEYRALMREIDTNSWVNGLVEVIPYFDNKIYAAEVRNRRGQDLDELRALTNSAIEEMVWSIEDAQIREQRHQREWRFNFPFQLTAGFTTKETLQHLVRTFCEIDFPDTKSGNNLFNDLIRGVSYSLEATWRAATDNQDIELFTPDEAEEIIRLFLDKIYVEREGWAYNHVANLKSVLLAFHFEETEHEELYQILKDDIESKASVYEEDEEDDWHIMR